MVAREIREQVDPTLPLSHWKQYAPNGSPSVFPQRVVPAMFRPSYHTPGASTITAESAWFALVPVPRPRLRVRR